MRTYAPSGLPWWRSDFILHPLLRRLMWLPWNLTLLIAALFVLSGHWNEAWHLATYAGLALGLCGGFDFLIRPKRYRLGLAIGMCGMFALCALTFLLGLHSSALAGAAAVYAVTAVLLVCSLSGPLQTRYRNRGNQQENS